MALTRQAFSGKNPEKMSIWNDVLKIANNERILPRQVAFSPTSPIFFGLWLLRRRIKMGIGKILSLPIGDEKKAWVLSKNLKKLIGLT